MLSTGNRTFECVTNQANTFTFTKVKRIFGRQFSRFFSHFFRLLARCDTWRQALCSAISACHLITEKIIWLNWFQTISFCLVNRNCHDRWRLEQAVRSLAWGRHLFKDVHAQLYDSVATWIDHVRFRRLVSFAERVLYRRNRRSSKLLETRHLLESSAIRTTIVCERFASSARNRHFGRMGQTHSGRMLRLSSFPRVNCSQLILKYYFWWTLSYFDFAFISKMYRRNCGKELRQRSGWVHEHHVAYGFVSFARHRLPRIWTWKYGMSSIVASARYQPKRRQIVFRA